MKIGDNVKIKECHSIPELVGKEAKVVIQADPEASRYPFMVVLTGDPIQIATPFGMGKTKGPFPFREDELELIIPPEIPDEIKKAFGE